MGVLLHPLPLVVPRVMFKSVPCGSPLGAVLVRMFPAGPVGGAGLFVAGAAVGPRMQTYPFPKLPRRALTGMFQGL